MMEQGRMRPAGPWCYHLGALVLLALFLWQTQQVVRESSATADEPIYIRSGYEILRQGDPSINDISSPFLMKAMNALPFLRLPGADRAAKASPGPEGTWPPLLAQWRQGTEMVRALGPAEALPLARTVPRLTALVTGLLLYAAAFRSLSPAAAWLGLAVFLLLPEVAAHSSLATLEAGLALFVFATLLALERFIRRPGTLWAAVVGLSLGGAILTKTTGWVLALFCVLAGAVLWFKTRGERGRIIRGMALSAVLAWIVVNAAFSFEGTLDRLADRPEYNAIEARFEKMPPAIGACLRWGAEHVPLLIPRSMVHTLITQVQIAGKGKRIFFNGSYSEEGWVWLMALTFLIKMPIAFLLLLAFALPTTRGVRGILLVHGGFALFLLLFFSLASRLNAGVRYLYPALPGLCLVAGAAASRLFCRGWGGRVLAASLLVWLAGAAIRVHPHPLSYLNEAAGGPEEAYRLVGDSNVDWGQDLPALARVMEQERIPRVRLSYFGSDDPASYGIRYDPLPSIGLRPEPGEPWWFEEKGPEQVVRRPAVYAVSANNLNGLFFRDPDLFAFLRAREPDYRAGYSILLYDLRREAVAAAEIPRRGDS